MKAVSYNQRKGGTERPYAQESHRALQGITMCFCPSHHLASLIHPESFFFWLHWVFAVAYRLSVVVTLGFLMLWSTGSRVCELSGCGMLA